MLNDITGVRSKGVKILVSETKFLTQDSSRDPNKPEFGYENGPGVPESIEPHLYL